MRGERADEADEARKVLTLAARLTVQVMAMFERDEAAAMRAFGSNAAHHVANDLASALINFKIKYPPQQPEEG